MFLKIIKSYKIRPNEGLKRFFNIYSILEKDL